MTSPSLKGHPISIEEMPYEHVFTPPIRPCGDQLDDRSFIERLFEGKLSALIIRGMLSADQLKYPVNALTQGGLSWGSPNQGMRGGEIRTIGEAATPCFTAFTGPSPDRYLESASHFERHHQAIFGDFDLVEHLSDTFSELFEGRPATPPLFHSTSTASSSRHTSTWLPFNYRALDAGTQIYSHHDSHYRLPIYESLEDMYDRESVLSWFITLQTPESGGALTLYGLWGSDPNPPMLPTRFLDTDILERDYLKAPLDLESGDLVIFDSGRHVHRVTPVVGETPRLTLGGFMTPNMQRTQLGFWS